MLSGSTQSSKVSYKFKKAQYDAVLLPDRGASRLDFVPRDYCIEQTNVKTGNKLFIRVVSDLSNAYRKLASELLFGPSIVGLTDIDSLQQVQYQERSSPQRGLGPR